MDLRSCPRCRTSVWSLVSSITESFDFWGGISHSHVTAGTGRVIWPSRVIHGISLAPGWLLYAVLALLTVSSADE